MSVNMQVVAEVRAERGKAENRRLRRLKDKIPGVVYGAGKENQFLVLSHKDMMLALEHESFYSQILTLNIGSAQEKVVLKDLQRHPVKNRLLHVDFLRVDPKEKLKMNVPLHFVGEEECEAVKDGGVITHLMNEVEIKCLPDNLPEFIEVDVSKLEMDYSLHLSDLKLPKGVELAHKTDENHDHTVVNVHLPRAAKEETEEAPVEAADAAEATAEAAEKAE